MIALALLIIVVLAFFAARNPLVRRVGFRNARRRPREAALVMLGCSLGTALIVGSASVGTSYTASLRDQALGELGPLDALVNYDTQAEWAAATAQLNGTPNDFAFTAPAALLGAPVTSDSSDATAPTALLIEADYARLAPMLGGLPATGPPPGTAWAAPALATRLSLREGAALAIHGPSTLRLKVNRLADGPLARFVESPLNRGENLIVPPGTIAKLQAATTQDLGVRYLTFVGAKGPHGNVDPAPESVARLERDLLSRVSTHNGRVTAVRADRLSAAIESGKSTSAFLSTIGMFGILSGALLLVNVLLMLAEERLAELGTLRAVGLSRRPLVQAFTLEGALYAIFGSTLGGGVGALLGRLMVSIAARAEQSSRVRFDLQFSITPGAIAQGIAAGFVLAVLVVFGTSYRISRLDVIRSIRGMPDPPRERNGLATPLLVLMIAVGVPLALYGSANQRALPLMIGPPLAFAAFGVLASRRWGHTAGVTLGCVPNIVWGIVFQVVNRDPDAPPIIPVIGGMIVVLCGVLLVNVHQATAAHAIRRVGRGRSTVTSRLGLANPLAHRVRTMLTVGPFALVVFTLAYAEGLAHLINTELANIAPRIAGEYQVYARSSRVNPFDFSTFDAPNVDKMARTSTIVTTFSGRGSDPSFWSITAIGRDFADRTPPPLTARDERFATDAAVYRAVVKNPDLVIVPSNFLFRGTSGRSRGEPEGPPRIGDVYTMQDPKSGAARDLTIAGIGQSDVVGSGAYYGLANGREFFGDLLVRNSAFFTTRGSPDELVQRLNRDGIENGMRAVVPEQEATESFSYASNVVNLYRSDLGIGLVVGVAGVGVVLVRSVRDRRRQIGTLRAMGFESRQVGNSFLLEGLFVAAQGIGVGMGLGMLMTMALSKSLLIKQIIGYYPPVPTPPLSMVLLTVFLLATSLAASYGPAKSASRIPPAVALRLVD